MKMKKQILSIISVGILAFGVISTANASYILFDQSTDTIDVTGQITIGTSITYEARILFTDDYNGIGKIFNEWTNAREDKRLYAGPQGFGGYNYPTAPSGTPIYSNSPLTINNSHHIAYVYDGSEERLYLDGQLKESRTASGNVGDGSGHAHIGAIFRDGKINSGFIGYMDTLRISDTARYSTSSFLPAGGDLSSDANTLLLYNFTELSGSSTVLDLSGNGHDGTLAVGFSGATSPTFSAPVPIPGAVWLFGSSIAGLVGLNLRRSDEIWKTR